MTSPLEQKLRITGPVVVTANRLADGAVIYRDGCGHWTTQLDRAAVVTTASDATELLTAAAREDVAAVAAYVAPVVVDGNGGVRPGNLREMIRHAGPTIALPGSIGL
jgi:hypothetical protein